MGKESLRSENKEVNLKGKFLILAFLSFLIGTLLELYLPLHSVGIMIIRFILIFSVLDYYIGFSMPN